MSFNQILKRLLNKIISFLERKFYKHYQLNHFLFNKISRIHENKNHLARSLLFCIINSIAFNLIKFKPPKNISKNVN